MAEWSNAVVLKTIEGHTSGGSNPSLSARQSPKNVNVFGAFYFSAKPSLLERRLKSKKPRLRQQALGFGLITVSCKGITTGRSNPIKAELARAQAEK